MIVNFYNGDINNAIPESYDLIAQEIQSEKMSNFYKRMYDVEDWVSWIHFMSVQDCLEEWTTIYYYGDAEVPIYEVKNKKLNVTNCMALYDGYSDICNWHHGYPGYDKQAFMNHYFMNVFVCLSDGGFCCRINRKNNKVVGFYAINEDDGHWFLTDKIPYIVNEEFSYLKGLLMAAVDEINVSGFNRQKVIEQIWNWTGKVEKTFR